MLSRKREKIGRILNTTILQVVKSEEDKTLWRQGSDWEGQITGLFICKALFNLMNPKDSVTTPPPRHGPDRCGLDEVVPVKCLEMGRSHSTRLPLI